MSHRIAAKITGVAGYVPPRVVTNADIEKIVDTNDEWVRTRTGIRERHFADPGVAASHLGTEAAQRSCSRRRECSAEEIDMIVVATVTPDMLFPATACLIQDRLGAKKAWGFDLSAACSGFAYALTVGAQFVGSRIAQESARHRHRRDDLDSGFQGPRNLRAVRRRRRRRAAGARRVRRRRDHRLRRTKSTARAAAISTCRPAARCIPPIARNRRQANALRPSGRASRYSSTPCGG